MSISLAGALDSVVIGESDVNGVNLDAYQVCSISGNFTYNYNQTFNSTGYAKYQFLNNNFNGSGNFTTTGFGTFSWIDKLAQDVAPGSPPLYTLRLWVDYDAVSGYSTYRYKDDVGMVRRIADNVFIGKNTNAFTILKGSVLYSCGSSGLGAYPLLCLAKANNISTMPSIGVAIENIANGGYGRVMSVGVLENIDTNLFNSNAPLYVSDVIAGNLTAIKPITPNLTQEIGTVLVKSATAGKIELIARSLTGNEFGTINNFIVKGNLTASYLFGNGEVITGVLKNYTNIAMTNQTNTFNVGQRFFRDVLVGNTTGGAYSCSGTPSVACDELGEEDCNAMDAYGYCYYDETCYDNSGMSCGMTTSVDCAIGGCDWLSGKIYSNINVTGRIKASCSGDGGIGNEPCISWYNSQGNMMGGFSNGEQTGYPWYNYFFLNSNSSVQTWMGEWSIADVANPMPSGDKRIGTLQFYRDAVGSGYYGFIVGVRNVANNNFDIPLACKTNAGCIIGTSTGNVEPQGLIVTKNLSVGNLIKLQTMTLPACNTGSKNVFGANITGTYGCNASAWVRIF